MYWGNFFKRMKFFEFIGLLVVLLIILGILYAFLGHGRLISAVLVYLITIFISYLSTVGLYVFYLEKRIGIKYCSRVDKIITFIIAVIFGYRFTGLFNYKIYSFLIYVMLWVPYIWYKGKILKEVGYSLTRN